MHGAHTWSTLTTHCWMDSNCPAEFVSISRCRLRRQMRWVDGRREFTSSSSSDDDDDELVSEPEMLDSSSSTEDNISRRHVTTTTNELPWQPTASSAATHTTRQLWTSRRRPPRATPCWVTLSTGPISHVPYARSTVGKRKCHPQNRKYILCVLLYYLHFVFYCTHVRMSYVLNSYLLTYL